MSFRFWTMTSLGRSQMSPLTPFALFMYPTHGLLSSMRTLMHYDWYSKHTINCLLHTQLKSVPSISTKAFSQVVQCLEILDLLARVRCSIFSNAEIKLAWLNDFIDGLGSILIKKKDLEDVRTLLLLPLCSRGKPSNRHHMARVLVALKSCWQFPQMLECKNYPEFMKKVPYPCIPSLYGHRQRSLVVKCSWMLNPSILFCMCLDGGLRWSALQRLSKRMTHSPSS